MPVTPTWTNYAILIVATFSAILLLRPSLIRHPVWRATVTPLASIIGSGFLVVGPILAPIAGPYAILAMAALCGTGYLFGAAIRHNIRYIEGEALDTLSRRELMTERLSSFALILAYFISVTYYLNLFASFGLRAIDVVDPTLTRWFATAVIIGIGLVGAFRGLAALEKLEAVSVGIKLSLILGLIAALLIWNGASIGSPNYGLPTTVSPMNTQNIGILLGLVILVQGFETSRYLGKAYDKAMRVRTMRLAQIISSVIYLAFIGLITPLLGPEIPMTGRETAIIGILAPLGMLVGPLIIFTALASQLSAAIADLNGAGGLLADATSHKLSVKAGYMITTAVALLVTWDASVMEIITYATKAFVIYYGLQSLLALSFTLRTRRQAWRSRAAVFGVAVLLALAVIAFGIPADA